MALARRFEQHHQQQAANEQANDQMIEDEDRGLEAVAEEDQQAAANQMIEDEDRDLAASNDAASNDDDDMTAEVRVLLYVTPSAQHIFT